MDGEMELGGVGSSMGCVFDGGAFAVTAAKVSLPVQNPASRGLGISTDAVVPATGRPMVEAALVMGAMMDLFWLLDIFAPMVGKQVRG